MALGFQIAAGTIPGRSHLGSGNLLLGKNNQDAFSVRVCEDCIIATVQDGCSSGAHSEIGAHIGGKILLRLLHDAFCGALQTVQTREEASERLERVRKRFLHKVAKVADLLIGPNCSEAARCGELSHKHCAQKQILHDCFLFTTLGIVVTPCSVIIFSIGDGVFALNGDVKQIGPFPNNAPPYIAYALLPSVFAYDPDALKFHIHAIVNTSDVESLLIATDGFEELIGKSGAMLPGKTRELGPASQVWSDDRFFDDDQLDLLTPWLRQVNSEVVKVSPAAQLERSFGLLSDDTTLVAMRRKH
ncbi:MAG: protein phosphatase 2C domain-containing protein [Candidatus Melainabacteria bacterium]|nr:protein phosphatase 2C domain-containing protein [Candidatus Melainabacteria bacterium]